MNMQEVFNVAFTIIMFLVGWIVKSLFDAISELRITDKGIERTVHELALSLADKYVPKDEFRTFSEAILKKLDRIEDKVDGKADKMVDK